MSMEQFMSRGRIEYRLRALSLHVFMTDTNLHAFMLADIMFIIFFLWDNNNLALLRRLGDRLQLLNSHDALVLLRYSLAIPKLYSLRSAPCFEVSSLCEYDNVLCSVLSSATNC